MKRFFENMGSIFILMAVWGLVFQAPVCEAADAIVSLISDESLGPAARHGLEKVKEALREKGAELVEAANPATARGGMLLVAGLAKGPGTAADLVREQALAPPNGPEAILIRRLEWEGKEVFLVCGSDDRGLMYGLLDAADRIGWAENAARPLSEIRDASEKPYTPERALSMYTMHRATFESFFYDKSFWERYLDMLARNRYNTFALIFGYENYGYFVPQYPYFYNMEEFPEVRLVGMTEAGQERNRKALRRVIAMAHERGLNFTLGIWDHIYRGNYGHKLTEPTRGFVWGLTGENLMEYSVAALRKFLKTFPEIDAIQFRMHGESGLKKGEMEEFWTRMYQTMIDHAPQMRFDARAKNYPDKLIYKALDMGLNIRICTKYWCEQLGMPFHPTHIPSQNQDDRRHGYADMLRYPKRYKMHWRLWNSGTARVLLWGDPEYARRFAESTHLYDGDGFEVNDPLSTKMQTQPHDAKPFELLRAKYRYYDWEFERYWHFYQAFGRMGYNQDTPPEVWRREFERRFGKGAAQYVEHALHQSSRVLPRINAYCFPYRNSFPTTRGWAEKQRKEDLPDYAKAGTSDTQIFLSMWEEAENRLKGAESAKVRPQQTSAWFAKTSGEILKAVAEAEKRIGTDTNKEFFSTMTDMKILANLALYHSRRIHAGINYALFKQSDDRGALDKAIVFESTAIEAWEGIVEAAGDVYHDNLMMGRESCDLTGHWKDELVALKMGLEKVREEREALQPEVKEKKDVAFKETITDDNKPPTVRHARVTSAPPLKPLRIAVEANDPSGVKWVRLRYRSVNQHQDYKTLEMKSKGSGAYEAIVPGEDIASEWDFMYLIEAMDAKGNGTIWPDFEEQAPYVVVRLER